MEFKATLTKKTSELDTTALKFEPVDHEICDCDSIIVKVPVDTSGYFVNKQYTVTILESDITE